MCQYHRRTFLRAAVCAGATTAFAGLAFAQAPDKPVASDDGKPKIYICPPCGCPMDGKDLPGPGDCPGCSMPLMIKPVAAAKTDPAKAEPPKAAAPKPADANRPPPRAG